LLQGELEAEFDAARLENSVPIPGGIWNIGRKQAGDAQNKHTKKSHSLVFYGKRDCYVPLQTPVSVRVCGEKFSHLMAHLGCMPDLSFLSY
jgi:hypothetical protein